MICTMPPLNTNTAAHLTIRASRQRRRRGGPDGFGVDAVRRVERQHEALEPAKPQIAVEKLPPAPEVVNAGRKVQRAAG